MKKLILGLLLSSTLLLPICANATTDYRTVDVAGQTIKVDNFDSVWKEIDGNKYYINNGELAKGWLNVSNGDLTSYHDSDWYYFDKTGKMLTNVIVDGYYLSNDGKGLFEEQFHRDPTKGQQGEFATTIVPVEQGQEIQPNTVHNGWVLVHGNWYYYYSNGKLATDTIIDGYTINSAGVWVK